MLPVTAAEQAFRSFLFSTKFARVFGDLFEMSEEDSSHNSVHFRFVFYVQFADCEFESTERF